GLFMALRGELVQRLPRQPPFLGDHLGRDALGDDVEALLELRRERTVTRPHGVRAHGHPRHVLDAAGNDRVVLAGHDAHCREVCRLLAGAAHPVESRAAYVDWEARDERGGPRDFESLLAELVDAAQDDVLDVCRIDADPPDEIAQDEAGQVVGADPGELAALSSDRGTHRAHDDRITHDYLLGERGPIIHLTGPSGSGANSALGDPALSLIGELAERANGPGGHLAAADALIEGDRLGALERGARPVEEAEEEVVLGARRGVLQAAQDLLVGDRGRAGSEWAFLDDVVNLA